MRHQEITRLALAAGSGVLAGTAIAGDQPQVDAAAVDNAFDALKTYDWGTDRDTLNPIDDAVVATQGNAAARKELETRLVAVLTSDACRGVFGSIRPGVSTKITWKPEPFNMPMIR